MNTITNIRVVANDHSVFDGIFNVYIGFAQRKPIHFQLTEQNIMFLFGGVLQQNAVQIALTEWRNSNPEKWARQYGAEYQSQQQQVSTNVYLQQQQQQYLQNQYDKCVADMKNEQFHIDHIDHGYTGVSLV